MATRKKEVPQNLLNLISKIEEAFAEFTAKAKGPYYYNWREARKISKQIEKLFLEYRKESIAAEKE